MYLPYVYIVTNNKTQQFYIGSRSKNVFLQKTPEDDLWIRYFTSSKYVKNLLTEYSKDEFTATVLFRFEDPEICYWYEQILIRERINDPLCLNKYYIDPDLNQQKFSVINRIGNNLGKRFTETHKENISKAITGKKYGKRSAEFKERISKTMTGRSLTDSHKDKVGQSKSATWKLIDLTTKQEFITTRLTNFCKEHQINYNSITQLFRMGKTIYKNKWSIEKLSASS